MEIHGRRHNTEKPMEKAPAVLSESAHYKSTNYDFSVELWTSFFAQLSYFTITYLLLLERITQQFVYN